MIHFCSLPQFYGPSVCSLAPEAAKAIERFLQLEGRLESEDPTEPNWELPVDDDDKDTHPRRKGRADKSYLFHTKQGVHHCFSSSHWCQVVKDTFAEFSPTGVATTPKTLRSSFIVALRDENFGDSAVLRSAANAMHHTLDTQARTPPPFAAC